MAIQIDPISIEPMLPSDLEAVQRIDNLCYPSPWYRGAYQTELNNRAACYFVARLNGETVGYAGLWVIRREAHITTLAVHPNHHRRKIGERLMIVLIEEALYRRASHLTLEVRENNRAAQNLYRKYGFRPCATRRNYYTDNGENAIVMWAEEILTPEFEGRLKQQKRMLEEFYQNSRR